MPLIAFTHIPKTAGTSLHRVFRRSFGMRYAVVTKRHARGERRFDGGDLRRLRRRYPRLQAVGGHSVVPHGHRSDGMAGARFVTMLRDPEVRLASHYAHQIRRELTAVPFRDWISDRRHHNLQVCRLAGEPSADAAVEALESQFAFTGLVERFAESLELLPHFVPGASIPPSEPHHNRNPLRDLRDEVLADPDSRASLREATAEDRKLYAYARDVIWPRQAAAAHGTPPGTPPEALSRWREKSSAVKERLVLGIPRRLAAAGIRIGDPL